MKPITLWSGRLNFVVSSKTADPRALGISIVAPEQCRCKNISSKSKQKNRKTDKEPKLAHDSSRCFLASHRAFLASASISLRLSPSTSSPPCSLMVSPAVPPMLAPATPVVLLTRCCDLAVNARQLLILLLRCEHAREPRV